MDEQRRRSAKGCSQIFTADDSGLRQPFGVPERFEGVDDDFAGASRSCTASPIAPRTACSAIAPRQRTVHRKHRARALVRWRRVHDYAPAWVARVSVNLALDRDPGDAAGEPTPPRRRTRRRTVPISPPGAVIWPLRSPRLPKRQREAVVLRYLVDLPEADTANAMGCTVGTVKSTVARGLDKLRVELGPQWAWDD